MENVLALSKSLGYLDDIPESAYFTPPLTTVRQDFDAVGRRSIELLLDLVNGTSAGNADATGTTAAVVAPELVVRHSTVGKRRPRP